MIGKFSAILILICAVVLNTAAQETELKIPAAVQPFVTADTKAVAVESADLNGDGTKDFILVLEDLKNEPDNGDEGIRSLLILTADASGKLTLAKRNDKDAVFCRTCGGVFGDPFEGIEVGAKTFTINLYGGSNWRWAYHYKFNYSRVDKTWQLVRAEENSFNTLEPNKMKTVVYTPPKHFGKIDIADFEPGNFLKNKPKN